MDDYKKLGKEWGRKARKEESRASKRRLRPDTAAELAQIESANLRESLEETDMGAALAEAVMGPSRLSRKKDTRKWCRGKAGREHDGVCMTYDEMTHRLPVKNDGSWSAGLSNARVLVCRRCRRQLAWWWGGRRKDRPAWVT